MEFKIKELSTGKVDCTFKAPEWALKTTAKSPSLSIESRALVLRLRDIYLEEFSQDDLIELAYEENAHKPNSAGSNRQANFRAFGALVCITEDIPAIDIVRTRELEITTINGRLATHGDRLADCIVNQVRLRRGDCEYFSCTLQYLFLLLANSQSSDQYVDVSVRFFIHIYSNSSKLVVKDTLAMVSVPQMDRLGKFLRSMAAKAIMSSDLSTSYNVNNDSLQCSVYSHNSSWNMDKKVVTGQHIISSNNPKSKISAAMKKDCQSSLKKPPPSPFSNACFDTVPRRPSEMKYLDKTVNTEKKYTEKPDASLLSFEDALFEQSEPEISSTGNANTYDFDPENEKDTQAVTSTWTRQRVKGVERSIAALAPEASTGTSGGAISLTKKMLSTAKVVAQVDEKFIIIKACGII